MRSGRAALAAAAVAGLAAACTERVPLMGPEPGALPADGAAQPEDAEAAGGPGGDARPDAGRADRPSDGAACLEMPRPPSRVQLEPAPDLIVSLDRSFSMISRFGSSTRLGAAHSALRALMRAYQTAIHFGYEEFPARPGSGCSQSGCCASPVLVLPRANAADVVDRYMRCEEQGTDCFVTSQETPSAEALRRCREFYDFFEPGGARHVLLITDGDPSCTYDRSQCERAVAETNRLTSMGVRTAVLGVSEEARGAVCLGNIALSGQMARPTAPHHLVARDEAELRQVLQELFAGIVARSCRITLRQPLASPDRATLAVAGATIPRDPTQKDGWSLDASSQRITIHGSWCERVRSFVAPEITITTTCTLCPGSSVCR